MVSTDVLLDFLIKVLCFQGFGGRGSSKGVIGYAGLTPLPLNPCVFNGFTLVIMSKTIRLVFSQK